MAEYKVVDAEKLDADLSSVADAIRTKGGTDASLQFPQGFVDAVDAIESGGGGTEEIESLIDQSGVLDSTDGTATEKVEQLIDKAELLKTVSGVVFKDNLDITKKTLDCSSFTTAEAMFGGCRNLKEVELSNTQNIKGWCDCFRNCVNIETIRTLDFSGATSITNCFYSCEKIKDIKIEPNSLSFSIILVSPLLTEESVQSVINGLAVVTKAQTVRFGSTIIVTDEQKATINAKGWTLVQ